MFNIGIIEDEQTAIDDIEVSFLDHYQDLSFKKYQVEQREKKDLFKEIQEDIIANTISGLIVDFKLDTNAQIITGEEIVRVMREKTPMFPTIILTNVPDDSKKSYATDVFRVHAKKVFLNPELPETKVIVNNIITDMEKYANNRAALEGKLEIELSKINRDSSNEEVLQKIIEIETELEKYKPMFQTSYTDRIDLKELKEAAELLEKCRKIIEE